MWRTRRLAMMALGVVALGAGLAGCAAMAGDCDPTRGGLFGGMACSSTGGYDRRIQERQNTQSDLLTKKAELSAEQSKLEAQRDQMEKDLVAKQAAYDRARRDLKSVQGKIASGKGNTSALQAEKKRLEGKVAQSGGDVDAAQAAEAKRKARIAQLEREQATLNQEFKALTDR